MEPIPVACVSRMRPPAPVSAPARPCHQALAQLQPVEITITAGEFQSSIAGDNGHTSRLSAHSSSSACKCKASGASNVNVPSSPQYGSGCLEQSREAGQPGYGATAHGKLCVSAVSRTSQSRCCTESWPGSPHSTGSRADTSVPLHCRMSHLDNQNAPSSSPSSNAHMSISIEAHDG